MVSVEEYTQHQTESRLRFYRRTTIVLAVICVFLLVVLAGQLTRDSSAAGPIDSAPASGAEAESSPTEPPSSTEQDDRAQDALATATYADSVVVTRDADDPLAIGRVDAPVVLTEWTDLRCPFCAAFARDTLPALLAEYIDTGLVRLEIHDVSFFGDQSEDAAVAARAAGEQGLAIDYLEAVYQAAPASGHPDLPREALMAFAKQVGVPDLAQFEADLDSAELRGAVQTSTASAQSLGVNSVPFFVVGDQALAGAQPVDVFRQYLDQALSAAGAPVPSATGASGAGTAG